MAARWPQDGPKMAARWPQDGPKMAPRRFQDGPKMALSWVQEVLRGFKRVLKNERLASTRRSFSVFRLEFGWLLSSRSSKIAEDGPRMVPRWPQDGPKMAPRWPQDGPKMAPRWPQDCLQMAQDSPERAREGLGKPNNGPKTAASPGLRVRTRVLVLTLGLWRPLPHDRPRRSRGAI